jgi:hypothetical protein
MASLAPFIERRSRARLRETPLRRRNHVGPGALARERRRASGGGLDVAGTLELHLDRYPTKPAMLTFLQSLIYAAEGSDSGSWRSDYVGALRQATDVMQDATTPNEAIATLHGYQAFMAQRYARRSPSARA